MKIKKLVKSKFIKIILCYLTSQYIKFVYSTSKWTHLNFETPNNLIKEKRPFIVAFWHGRLLMLTCVWKSENPLNLLISRHNDGELIALTVKHLGLKTIRGSTNKKGAEAIRIIIKKVRKGEWIGISPDGPHGPRMQSSEGIAQISRLTKTPIIPLTYSTTKMKVLNSWDRFIIPFPFAKGIFIWGEIIEPPIKNNNEAIQSTLQKIDNELIKLCKFADEYCNITPITKDYEI
ncbi:lysophospholipid acyltransferase family protein [Alphaproteobacteria bacterium]|nr:lysophospholipid acyltransferase family protein [Alphaproteobacteria bacterium]